MDTDLEILRDFCNSLEQLVLALFNPDGTLKANSVNTASIQDRAVTIAKLAFRSIFYYVDSGLANAMAITTTSGALTAYASGIAFWIKAAANNTGATTCNVDGLGNRAVKKINASGLVDLAAGDIITSGIYLLVDDGVELVLLNPTLPIHGYVTNHSFEDTVDLQTHLNDAAGVPVIVAHTATMDTIVSVRWSLLCISNDGGYESAGPGGPDELDFCSCLAYIPGGGGDPDTDFDSPFGVTINTSNLQCDVISTTPEAGVKINARSKTGGTDFDLDGTKWKLKVRWSVVT